MSPHRMPYGTTVMEPTWIPLGSASTPFMPSGRVAGWLHRGTDPMGVVRGTGQQAGGLRQSGSAAVECGGWRQPWWPLASWAPPRVPELGRRSGSVDPGPSGVPEHRKCWNQSAQIEWGESAPEWGPRPTPVSTWIAPRTRSVKYPSVLDWKLPVLSRVPRFAGPGAGLSDFRWLTPRCRAFRVSSGT